MLKKKRYDHYREDENKSRCGSSSLKFSKSVYVQKLGIANPKYWDQLQHVIANKA